MCELQNTKRAIYIDALQMKQPSCFDLPRLLYLVNNENFTGRKAILLPEIN